MTQAPPPQAAAPGLAALSSRARARLAELGLPTARLEEWRFTNPAPITRIEWAAPADPGAAVPAGPAFGDWPRHEATLVGGRFVATPGAAAGAPTPAEPGLRVEGLAAAAAATPELVLARLGALAPIDTPASAFVTQNTARLSDGVFVHVAAGVAVRDPLVVAHRPSPGAAAPALVAGRVLVVVEAGASLTLVEDFRGFAAAPDFANAVTEIDLAPGARLTLVRLVGELATGYHVGAAFVRAGRGAGFTATTIATGGPLLRDDVHVHFAGADAEATLDGLFVVSGTQVVDHHTLLDHAVPACVSRELYKGVLDGSGRGVFNGAVLIRQDAQKSDSGQRNPNLLLSADATIHTKPELQIHADDVKCAHGATVGQLDANALFYLRARGIDAAAARAILVHAFAREVVARLAHPGLRADVDAWVEARMARLAGSAA